MSHNPLWTPTKFTVLSSTPNCSGPSSSSIEYSKTRLLSLFPSDAYEWADRSVPSLIRRMALEYMPYNPNEYLPLLFSAGPISSSFTAETHPWSTDLSGVTTTRRLATFSKSFYKLPIGSFPTFKGPLIFLAKTPLKYLVSCLLTFQPCHCKLPTSSRYPLV